MNDDKSRAAFEAWLTSHFDVSSDRYPDNYSSAWSGNYKTYTVQLAWLAWQAAIEHARKSQQPILSLDEARKRRCCRVCLGPDTASPELGVFVLNYGTEYAHEKCIGGD